MLVTFYHTFSSNFLAFFSVFLRFPLLSHNFFKFFLIKFFNICFLLSTVSPNFLIIICVDYNFSVTATFYHTISSNFLRLLLSLRYYFFFTPLFSVMYPSFCILCGLSLNKFLSKFNKFFLDSGAADQLSGLTLLNFSPNQSGAPCFHSWQLSGLWATYL